MWRNTRSGWGLISIGLHWLSAIAIIGLFVLGWWMTGLDYYSNWYHTAPWWHRGIGMLVLLATLMRLVWRLLQPHPEAHGSRLEQRAASLGHVAIYLLLLAVLISGYLISTAEGKGIAVLDWFTVPALLHGLPEQASRAGVVHWYSAIALMVLSAGHALAALKHHFIDRQDTLVRILSPRPSRRDR
ncbi:cytochrome b [Halomonas cupida]|uniref:Cytochrome b561 n=1 Tax=Halomonas cupida TaxID=44933 RepID=A0A1M7AFV9_9GAMM|nr:cytochrome b [Halomonas cupida]SHL41620.1 Cytochrome b561 [Halomonas cupida]